MPTAARFTADVTTALQPALRGGSPRRRVRCPDKCHDALRVTSPSLLRSGKPVTIQVTTASGSTRPVQTQPDIATRLTSRYQTQRDIARRNRQAWHARGPEFESP